MFPGFVKPKIFWIGYSPLHFSLAACFAYFRPKARHKLVLLAKTCRFPDHEFEGFKVFRLSQLNFIGITLFTILSGSQVFSSGISPNTTSFTDYCCFRLLWLLNRLNFYDDGLAGCISGTYVWLHTRSIFPNSKGSITWDYTSHSNEFIHALYKVPLKYIKHLTHLTLVSNQETPNTFDPKIILFIESAACDHQRLFDHFMLNISNHDRAFYFPHTGKASVASTFSHEHHVLSEYNKICNVIDIPVSVGSLEATLISVIESAASVDLYCGCTSTLLLVLEFFKHQAIQCKLRVFVSPSFSNIPEAKFAQSNDFYNLLEDSYACYFSLIRL